MLFGLDPCEPPNIAAGGKGTGTEWFSPRYFHQLPLAGGSQKTLLGIATVFKYKKPNLGTTDEPGI